jgi:asparagine synthase (glutamine-hydrolysing)
MCGILGIAAARGRRVSVDARSAERMRDTMAHRGPDGAGLLDLGNVVLAHRRLAVIDRTLSGHQPMATQDGRFTLVYNGELYNDAEVRAELAAAKVAFRGASDAETVLHALAAWGPGGMAKLRGMYALALFDTREQTLLLARDPLGIKPLYWWRGEVAGGAELAFASEIQAILAHPGVKPEPDIAGVSAYLTTIRTSLGERTLFRGVRAMRPGEVLLCDLTRAELPVSDVRCGISDALGSNIPHPTSHIRHVRETVRDSVARHLRADVPVCCLLSGGLDSAIVSRVAKETAGALDTYCSGAPGSSGDDFAFARIMAAALGSRHVEAPVTREMFQERWAEMVARMGIPLSTPNEIAINEVARRLRADGKVVALSGEGADELFGGYDGPLTEAARFEGIGVGNTDLSKATGQWRGVSGGAFQLLSNAWVAPAAKGQILQDRVWKGLEGDAALLDVFERESEALRHRPGDDSPLQAHLRFQRRVNLAGLLQRLDSATMLEGVEGRTPLADVEVRRLAESLPMALKFTPRPLRTKIALREAFGADLPPEIVKRPKASFPLPFQEWMADQAGVLRESELIRELFTPAAIEVVASEPQRLWNMAWPMINLALWAKRWWS